MTAPLAYTASTYAYTRRPTRVVVVGENNQGPMGVGGDNPIRVQSMTTTNTLDTDATVAQIVRLVDVGCEIVRVTAPKVKDAENLGAIRRELSRRRLKVPLVADIHFLPSAALEAAKHADKVRVNPGNYADRKVFEQIDYTDAEYSRELERIADKFAPLIRRCKEYGRSMRIGTNHGSLSDRIMSRFGDSPEGMVESALEFVRICEAHDYRDIILSMKASNPGVMIAANRLLVARMTQLGMDYPLHLGVTEAGDGEDGRIKSAVGIGSLLEDGIGDTIRVSLTEEPECEVPVAFALVRQAVRAGRLQPRGLDLASAGDSPLVNPYSYARRRCEAVQVGPVRLGATEPPRVEVRVDLPVAAARDALAVLRPMLARSLRPGMAAQAPDGHEGCEIIAVSVRDAADLSRLRALREAVRGDGARQVAWSADIAADPALAQQLVGLVDKLAVEPRLAGGAPAGAEALRAIAAVAADSGLVLQWNLEARAFARAGGDTRDSSMDAGALWDGARRLLECGPAERMILGVRGGELIPTARFLTDRMHAAGWKTPVLLHAVAAVDEDALLSNSVRLGALLCDGVGDAVRVDAALPPARLARLAYDILQASGRRITKTEFISCPSCGRTQFDLQKTTERIKARTGHLKDVRIAIMGCIVNGPGEMADADFGYVGTGSRRISLYVGKECVTRDIAEEEAEGKLIDLIKAHGKWVQPAGVAAQKSAPI